MRCSSSVRPSFVVVNFSLFWLLLWNPWTQFPLASLSFLDKSLSACVPFQKEVLRCTLMASCLVHLSCMFKCTIVITHYPLSVRRRKLLTFSTHLCNCWTEFNETSQEARSQRPLPSLCFSGRSETQDDRTVLWFTYTFSTSSLLPVNRIRQNLTGSKNLTSFTKFVFFGRSENRDGSLVLWLTKTFSLNVSNGLWQNLTGSNQRGPTNTCCISDQDTLSPIKARSLPIRPFVKSGRQGLIGSLVWRGL